MPILAFLNIGTFELLVVLVVAVMLFGGDLPDVARKAARMVGRVRTMAQDLGRELNRPDLGRHTGLGDVHDEIRDIDASVRGTARPGRRLPPPRGDVTERGLDPAHEVARDLEDAALDDTHDRSAADTDVPSRDRSPTHHDDAQQTTDPATGRDDGEPAEEADRP